jgi:hypothetical protein
MPACWRKAPGLCGVSLLAVSFSPTDARHASPLNAVQFLKTAGLRIWNFMLYFTHPMGSHAPFGEVLPFFILRRASCLLFQSSTIFTSRALAT